MGQRKGSLRPLALPRFVFRALALPGRGSVALPARKVAPCMADGARTGRGLTHRSLIPPPPPPAQPAQKPKRPFLTTHHPAEVPFKPFVGGGMQPPSADTTANEERPGTKSDRFMTQSAPVTLHPSGSRARGQEARARPQIGGFPWAPGAAGRTSDPWLRGGFGFQYSGLQRVEPYSAATEADACLDTRACAEHYVHAL